MVQEYGTYKEPGLREAGSPFPWRPSSSRWRPSSLSWRPSSCRVNCALQSHEDGRHGNFLRTSRKIPPEMFVAAAGETFWKGGFDSFFLVSMGIFYNIPRFPRYFYRFSVRSVSLKIKLIVIPGLLYGFSKYPLVWIETVVHEIRFSTLYFLRNSCFCKMLNNRKIQIYAFWRGVLCVLTSFEVWCSVFLRPLQDCLL